jgi:RNA polymerase sigma-70 factor (sigma-E family)
MRDEAGFRTFVEANGATLLHTARLLTGDHHRGEDLVQGVLTKVYLKWDRVDAPLAYARKALVTGHIDSTRRRWWGERPTEVLPEEPGRDGADGTAGIVASDERDELRRLLGGLSPRERAVVVLRYYCDQSEQDTAAALGMPVGTVKSTCARALARLRVEATASMGGQS